MRLSTRRTAACRFLLGLLVISVVTHRDFPSPDTRSIPAWAAAATAAVVARLAGGFVQARRRERAEAAPKTEEGVLERPGWAAFAGAVHAGCVLASARVLAKVLHLGADVKHAIGPAVLTGLAFAAAHGLRSARSLSRWERDHGVLLVRARVTPWWIRPGNRRRRRFRPGGTHAVLQFVPPVDVPARASPYEV